MDKVMFENTVLAILTASPGLGSIQVRKALCIADALHHSLHGESITGSRYIKEKYGPVPDNEGYRCFMEMVLSDKIVNDEIYAGYGTENHFYANSEPDIAFTPSQLGIITYAARTACHFRATELSLKTHDDVYNRTPMRAEIPLSEICKPVAASKFETEPFTEEESLAARRFFESNEARIYGFV
ncbi:MAG: SocA family protein [Treponema sp.]|jgi:hypothetical protein|nr:SocA family protein [Treponema sp.]